jgi:hypothetical protein
MAKKYSIEEIAAAFQNLLEGGSATAAVAEEELELLDEEETRALSIKELRALAVERKLEEQKSKAGILAELASSGAFGDAEDEDEDEDDEDEEEEEDEDEDDLSEKTLPELRTMVKAAGKKVPRGADQDTLIALLQEDDEDEEDEDEDEDDEDEDDVEEEEIDEDALKKMGLKELRELADDLELKIKVPATAKTVAQKKAHYVKKIMASAE